LLNSFVRTNGNHRLNSIYSGLLHSLNANMAQAVVVWGITRLCEAPAHLPCTPAMSWGRKLSFLRCYVRWARGPALAGGLVARFNSVVAFVASKERSCFAVGQVHRQDGVRSRGASKGVQPSAPNGAAMSHVAE
jgi:hypothetical protein